MLNSRFAQNSEASVSEFLENREDFFVIGTSLWTHDCIEAVIII